MSKARAFLYSMGAPILYILLRFAILLIIFMILMTSAVADNALPTNPSDLNSFFNDFISDLVKLELYTALAAGAVFTLILWLRHRRHSVKLWTAVGLTKAVSVKTLCLAAFAGLAFHVACQGILQALPIPQSWYEANEVSTQIFADTSFFSVITVGLLIPFFEEIAFRGFTQRILHHAFTPWTAVILQGAIFGMFHSNALQTMYAFTTGVVIGYIYMKSRSLWATVCFHAVFNSTNFIMSLIFDSVETLSSVAVALMAAGGVTLTLFLVRNIEFKSVQKEAME